MNSKMQLRPLIASYLAGSASAIRQALDSRALEAVAQVTAGPVCPAEIEPALLDTLLEMRVFRQEGGRICLDTAVFLEADIAAVNRLATEIKSPFSSFL